MYSLASPKARLFQSNKNVKAFEYLIYLCSIHLCVCTVLIKECCLYRISMNSLMKHSFLLFPPASFSRCITFVAFNLCLSLLLFCYQLHMLYCKHLLILQHRHIHTVPHWVCFRSLKSSHTFSIQCIFA